MNDPHAPVTEERRKLSDENLAWALRNVLPGVMRDAIDPVLKEMRDWRKAQIASDKARDDRMDRVEASVKSHKLDCFMIALVTAAAVSALLRWYWH